MPIVLCCLCVSVCVFVHLSVQRHPFPCDNSKRFAAFKLKLGTLLPHRPLRKTVSVRITARIRNNNVREIKVSLFYDQIVLVWKG